MSSETVSGLSPKQWAGMVYLLQGAGFFTGGLTTLAGIIVNHIAMEKVESEACVFIHLGRKLTINKQKSLNNGR